MNRRQPAVLFSRTYKRKSGKKSVVWWHYISDQHGRRQRFSLSTSSKTEARALLSERTRAGELVPQRIRPTRLAGFARDFWDWERSPYIRQKRLRGDRISRHWARQNSGYLENHVLPALGKRPLHDRTLQSQDARAHGPVLPHPTGDVFRHSTGAGGGSTASQVGFTRLP